MLQPGVSFEYGLALGNFSSESHIQLMKCLAEQLLPQLAVNGQISIVVRGIGLEKLQVYIYNSGSFYLTGKAF